MATFGTMYDEIHFQTRPGLLVSVRNSDEAAAALAGGADVIDVKEPDRGSLGAADPATIAAVVRAVGARVPVTAAAGELLELATSRNDAIPDGVSLFKIGLAGCGEMRGWVPRWRETFVLLAGRSAARPVAVAYADWLSANAPRPQAVLEAAVSFGCPALLIDTWDKASGALFDHWPAEEVAEFVRAVQARRLMVVLAGSLCGEGVAAAARLRPDLVAVRGAACDDGRRGSVSRDRVRLLRRTLRQALETVAPAKP
jgi:uncharacterized protein (UPF0264 family)